jgi:hypothetical protein
MASYKKTIERTKVTIRRVGEKKWQARISGK